MAKISKRFRMAIEGIDAQKAYDIDEAVKLVKSRATAKFDETIEVAVNLGVLGIELLEVLPSGWGDFQPEHVTRGCADRLGAEGIGASRQHGKGGRAGCCGGPADRADVARVLDPIQHEQGPPSVASRAYRFQCGRFVHARDRDDTLRGHGLGRGAKSRGGQRHPRLRVKWQLVAFPHCD